MMTSDQASEYLSRIKEGKSEEQKEPITPETEEEVKDAPAETPDKEEVTETKEPEGVEQKQVEEKPDDKGDETKAEVKEETEPKKEPEVSKRDYAFERLKRKNREQKEKYEARIKELEDKLKQGEGLKAEHFKKQDGSPDTDGYVDWKFKQRDMEKEIEDIRRTQREQQLQDDIEEDRRRVENCFQDEKERNEYNDLIARNGKAFYEAVNEVDKDGVVFSYLSTMPEYPVVLRELMTDSKLLGYAFRTTDPDSLKRNIAAVADQILERRHSRQSTPEKEEKPKEEPKKAIPVIGKQITASQGSANVVRDRSYWNNYLRQHPRG